MKSARWFQCHGHGSPWSIFGGDLPKSGSLERRKGKRKGKAATKDVASLAGSLQQLPAEIFREESHAACGPDDHQTRVSSFQGFFFGWSSDLVETKCLSFALLCPHCFASFAGWFKLRGLHPPGFETRQLHDWIGQRFQLGSLIIKWKSYRQLLPYHITLV